MRITLIADTFSVQKGTGIARYCRELLRGLTSQGLEMETIAPGAPGVPLGPVINHAVRMPYLAWQAAGRSDLIHAASPITALGLPFLSKPKVVTYHDLISLLCRNTSSALHTRLSAPIFLRIGRFADRIIAVSSQTRDEMVEHLGLPPEKISVVNYGISDIFRPMKPERGQELVVGYVGAFNRRKGVDYLLRAFSVLGARGLERTAKLALIGPKSLEYGALVRLAEHLHIDGQVEFRDFTAGHGLVRTYNSFDVYVHPSEWEGFGLPILEAQRCGVPVIIRKDAHIPEEVSACCLKATSEEDMADKICELVTDLALRKEIVEAGLEHSQHFTWERAVKDTVRVYETAVGNR